MSTICDMGLFEHNFTSKNPMSHIVDIELMFIFIAKLLYIVVQIYLYHLEILNKNNNKSIEI